MNTFPAILPLLGLLGACTTVIVPPADVADPVPIFLLDHGRHASLVLPTPDGNLVRWAYGDWRYYALARNRARDGTAALLWSTPAGLGRKMLSGPPTVTSLRSQLRVGVESVLLIPVEARQIAALNDRLQAIHDANRSHGIYNAAYDLQFTPHPESYSLLHNSNTKMAQWLEALGCEVQGAALYSRWRLTPS